MKGFAAFVMRGPVQAGSVAGAGMLGGLVLPPLAMVSSAVVALVVLKLGLPALARMAVPALAAVIAVGALVWRAPVAVTLAGLAAWLPVIAVAAVLHRRARLDDALLVACGLGWMAVLVIYGTVAEPVETWREVLREIFPPDRMAADMGVDADAVVRMIDRAAPLMTGLVAASAVFSTVASVLLARWWQSLLDRPGAFGEEFRSLRLGRVAAMVAAVLCLMAAFTEGQLLDGLALVAVAVYLFQGLAVAHGVIAGRGMATGWLVGLYALVLVLPPQVIVGLAVTGIADAWADFRRSATTTSS